MFLFTPFLAAQHLIARMLDPYAKTRATIQDVLSHPWLNPLPRKSSLQLPAAMRRSRRQGMSHSHSSSLQICAKLIEENSNSCVCDCHKLGTNHLSHCEDCQSLVNILSTNGDTHIHSSTLSVSSSGYSSMESLAFTNNLSGVLTMTIPELTVNDVDREDIFA